MTQDLSLPGGSTSESHNLYDLANGIVQECPPRLGAEIIVIGSVSLGIADAASDVDLELWLHELASLEEAIAWLERAGAEQLISETRGLTDEFAIVFRHKGIWFEASWHRIDSKLAMLQSIMDGEKVDRANLVQAYNVLHAVPLRTTGILGEWQQLLSRYPDVVQERVVAIASEFWRFPHRVDILWALAERQDCFGLMTWLMADLEDALRILFATNRQWEPDWKHLQSTVQDLPVKPERLISRIDKIISAEDLRTRVATSLLLILDILACVPSTCDISSAVANVRRSLEDHGVSVRI